jgi:pimeloyl-ACP methyl ester carboxylesterase
MPAQPVREPALADYIARKGLRQISEPDGRSGWTWRQDPDMRRKFERGLEQGPFPGGPVAVETPIVHVMGDRSHVVLHPVETPLAADVPRIVIPDCGHHVMLDQPLALVAVLRALLAVWPQA